MVSTLTNPTLADIAAATGPGGGIAPIVEILSQVNECLDDMSFVEGNLPTGHRTTIRAGLPTPTWRKLYGGVQPTKSARTSITDSCGMLEAYAEVDKALADLNGNSPAFRLSEDKAHLEGISQEVARTLFYGNEGVTPEAFTGFAPRFNSLSADNGDNIIDAGGTGTDNTSVWLVVWGPDTCHAIYPKGSKAGLQHKDLGEVTIENADGANGRMQAYRTHYRWDVGLCVRDWRYVVRIANIDVSDMADPASAKTLVTHMIKASERIPALGTGRACWYANRTVRTALRLGIQEKTVTTLTFDSVAGKRVTAFDGIPVRLADAILNTEARVV